MGTYTTFSRRTFLAAAGLGTATLLWGCSTTGNVPPIPPSSPFKNGPYIAGTAFLGGTTDPTSGLSQPLTPGQFGIPNTSYSQFPAYVQAAVYYPYVSSFPAKGLPISLTGPFPVLLYAHAYRSPFEQNAGSQPATQDYTSVAIMLQHVASYGCVCIAPDLSWLTDEWASDTATTFDERAAVLAGYYDFLSTLNEGLFKKQLDLSRLILAGHSTGAGGAVHAGRTLTSSSVALSSLSYGLIAPEGGGNTGPDTSKLLVLGGTLDLDQGADPQSGYTSGGSPKTLVMIPGANHFGYTDLCPANNACDSVGFFDEDGTISRAAQQLTGASYLAALARYYTLGDATAGPYLSGQQQVEGLAGLGVTGIQVTADFQVVTPPPNPTPPRPTVVTHP